MEINFGNSRGYGMGDVRERRDNLVEHSNQNIG